MAPTNLSVRLLLLAVVSATVNALLTTTACNADNCARAVTGTAAGVTPPLASRRADCASFFAITLSPPVVTSTVTVTPAAVTISSATSTATFTTTVTTLSTNAVQKRTVPTGTVTISPSHVPTYASACSGISRYSSACSCAGFKPATTVLTASTVVTTVTASTSTTTINFVASTTTTTVAPAVQTPTVVRGGGSCGCSYSVVGNSMYTNEGNTATTVTDSLMACIQSCDDDFECDGVNYVETTDTCIHYDGSSGSPVLVAAANEDAAMIVFGSCTGVCTNGSL